MVAQNSRSLRAPSSKLSSTKYFFWYPSCRNDPAYDSGAPLAKICCWRQQEASTHCNSLEPHTVKRQHHGTCKLAPKNSDRTSEMYLKDI